MGIKQFDKFCEVSQRARQSVHFIYDDGIDVAGLDISQKPLKVWTFQSRSRYAAVIVMVCNQPPTFVCLALDISFASLSLGIERIELKI